MSRRPYPPDFVSRETLAYRLDLRASDIDRMVTAGMLPAPLHIGNEKRWRWSDVEARLVNATPTRDDDPYMRGIANNGGRTSAVRQARAGQG